MATKLFLALQCVQCDTMQVKQQKKSSNKWVCVVCNQRQSVLRVHARGYRAADLRRFVQDANLARGRREFAHLAEPDADWDPAAVEVQGDEFPTEKNRTDWSEYLDDAEKHRDGCGGVCVDASDEDVKGSLYSRLFRLPLQSNTLLSDTALLQVDSPAPWPVSSDTAPSSQRCRRLLPRTDSTCAAPPRASFADDFSLNPNPSQFFGCNKVHGRRSTGRAEDFLPRPSCSCSIEELSSPFLLFAQRRVVLLLPPVSLPRAHHRRRLLRLLPGQRDELKRKICKGRIEEERVRKIWRRRGSLGEEVERSRSR